MRTENNRKQLLAQFFYQNKHHFIFAVVATMGMSLVNLGISWLLQQVIDVMTGVGNTFDLWALTLISIGLILSILVIGWIMYQ